MLTEEQQWQRLRFLMGRENYRYFQIMMENRFSELQSQEEWDAGDRMLDRFREIHRTDETFRKFIDTKRAAA